MGYEDCVGLAIRDYQSWLIIIVGLTLALVLRQVGLPRAAVSVAVLAMLGGLFVAYGFYEMNCVELYGL